MMCVNKRPACVGAAASILSGKGCKVGPRGACASSVCVAGALKRHVLWMSSYSTCRRRSTQAGAARVSGVSMDLA